MSRDVTEEERSLIEQMSRTIAQRRARNQLRHNFVEAEKRLNLSGYEIPPAFDKFKSVLNWPQKAVTAFAARQVPTGFSTTVASSIVDDIMALWEEADYKARERMVIESADEFGVSFVFTTLGDQSIGEPVVVFSPRTALTATCILDRRTGAVSAALEVVDYNRHNLYVPGKVLECERRDGSWRVVNEVLTGTRRVMCAPHVHGATLVKPLGRSRVTQPVMDLTMAAMRVLIRQEVSGQIYMAPRPVIKGASTEDFDGDPWSILLGEAWAIPDVSVDDDPDVPDALRRVELQMIPQLSMQPYSDQFRLIAGVASSAMSIPPQYLGVMQDSNPTSAQAIEASEIDLTREVRAQNPILGMGRKTLALNALALLYGQDFSPAVAAELRGLSADWEDPRTRSMTEQSQMVALQVQAGNMQPGTRTTLKQLPISAEDVNAAVEENRRAAAGSVLDRALAEVGTEAGGAEGPSLAERANTFRILIRSGALPESAAQVAAGLIDISQVKMRPGAPVTWREDGED